MLLRFCAAQGTAVRTDTSNILFPSRDGNAGVPTNWRYRSFSQTSPRYSVVHSLLLDHRAERDIVFTSSFVGTA